MRATTRSILVLALLISTPVLSIAAGSGGNGHVEQKAAPLAAAAPTDVKNAPTVALHDATPELAARVEWALGRFAAAGLHLPPLDISFHESGGGCHGHPGYFRNVSGLAVIDVCMPTKHMILHELAHAWAFWAVSAETQVEFLRHWDLSTWNADDVEWGERGGEKAADTIAFALGDLPSNPRDNLLGYLCSYTLLTAKELPDSDLAELQCDHHPELSGVYDRGSEHGEHTLMAVRDVTGLDLARFAGVDANLDPDER